MLFLSILLGELLVFVLFDFLVSFWVSMLFLWESGGCGGCGMQPDKSFFFNMVWFFSRSLIFLRQMPFSFLFYHHVMPSGVFLLQYQSSHTRNSGYKMLWKERKCYSFFCWLKLVSCSLYFCFFLLCTIVVIEY